MPVSNDLTDALFQKIAAYVYQVCGIHLTERKRELVNTRIGKIIREKNLSGFHEYYNSLVDDTTGEAVSELMNAISTNLTSFFRESKHFDFLEKELIPELRARALKSGNLRLRVWSAGCSTGAEVYTLAMVILQTMPDLLTWNTKFLATDIDTNVMAAGTEGVYSKEMVKPVPMQYLAKYFQRSADGSRYRVKAILRNLVQFKYLNLIEPFPFRGKFDIIFCRNVMIYFDKTTQQSLVDKFSAALNPGGVLFIGHSEGLSGLKHNLNYIRPTIYQKK
jgi:chemotaxis protein methyltransferase CheR